MSEAANTGRASWSLLIYEEYVAVMGSWNGAAVLARMLKLDEIVQEMDRQTESLNARAITEGRRGDVLPLRDGWFWKKEEELAKETFLTRSTAHRMLESGEQKGFWTRRLGEKYDGNKRGASWYKVDRVAIDRACKEAGYAGLPGFNPEGDPQLESHVQNEHGYDTTRVQNEHGYRESHVQNEQGRVQNEHGPCPKWTNTVLDIAVSNSSKQTREKRVRASDSTSSQKEPDPPWLQEILQGASQSAAGSDVQTDLDAQKDQHVSVAVTYQPEEEQADKGDLLESSTSLDTRDDGKFAINNTFKSLVQAIREQVGPAMMPDVEDAVTRYQVDAMFVEREIMPYHDEEGMEPEVLLKAVEVTARKILNGVRTATPERYMAGMIKRWHNQGIKTLGQLKAKEPSHFGTPSQADGSSSNEGAPNASAYQVVSPDLVERWKELYPDEYED